MPLPCAVTVEASISARTSFAMRLIATEMPTAIAAALPLADAPTAMAAPTAVASIVASSEAPRVTSPSTAVRPFATTVLPLRIVAWMSVSIVLEEATPAPASAPPRPDVEPPPAALPATETAWIVAVDVASSETAPAAVTREWSISAMTDRPPSPPISLSETDTPIVPAAPAPLPRLAATAIAKPPVSARTVVSSLATISTSPAVAVIPSDP